MVAGASGWSGLGVVARSRGRSAWLALLGVAVCAPVFAGSAAAASTGAITEFSSGLNSGSKPSAIAAGADGNLWFTAYGTTPDLVGRVTPSGTITEYGTANGLNSSASPNAIAAGADGNMWFTDGSVSHPAIGRITPSGTITEYAIPNGVSDGSSPFQIAAGADGNMWFTDESTTHPAIGRITPNGTITEYDLQNTDSTPAYIAAGDDGNIWFTDEGSPAAIGVITPSGAITEYAHTVSAGSLNANSYPYYIAAGADGNMWFTDIGCSGYGGSCAIGRITPSGTITEYTSGVSIPSNIAAGGDGNMWFADDGSRSIGRVTPGGTITEFTTGLNASASPSYITAGADGDMWFTDDGTTKAVGRITPSGTITEYAHTNGLNSGSEPEGIAAGSDGNVWFTDAGTAGALGRVGTGVPAASQLAPVVAGGGQAGIAQVCEGAEWSNFASEQPVAALLPFDGFQWLLNGSIAAGQTSDSFTPTSGDVGDTLACEQTVSYPLTPVTAPSPEDVSAAATSAAITVISQNSGPAGANGSNGAQGPAGPQGAAGPQGPAGEIELVTCTKVKGKRKCSTHLTSSPQTFTENAARASVSRAAHVYASGSLQDGTLTLHATKALHAGRYTLELTTGRGKSKHTVKESITVAQTITIG